MSEANRILVLAPNWLGDAVMAVPCVEAIRRHYPDVSLAVAARAHLAQLYEMVEGVDEALPLRPVGRFGGWLAALQDARHLRAGRFDVAILLPNSFRAAWIVRRAGIAERWGYASDARRLMLTRAVPRVRGGHMVEYYRRLLDGLGIPPTAELSGVPFDLRSSGQGRAAQGQQPATGAVPGTADLPSVHVAVPPDARAWARRTLAGRGCAAGDVIVGMAPGAAYGGAKQWGAERFAQLAMKLAARPKPRPATSGETGASGPSVRCVLVGSVGDRVVCDEVARASGDAVINLAGQTDLRQLAALMAECRAFVTNDSGAMHLAAAVGVPVVAIFGSTNEKETAPLPISQQAAGGRRQAAGEAEGGRREPEGAHAVGPELQLGPRVGLPAHAILTADVPCRPCMLRECPIEGHPCMAGITAERVLEELKGFWLKA